MSRRSSNRTHDTLSAWSDTVHESAPRSRSKLGDGAVAPAARDRAAVRAEAEHDPVLRAREGNALSRARVHVRLQAVDHVYVGACGRRRGPDLQQGELVCAAQDALMGTDARLAQKRVAVWAAASVGGECGRCRVPLSVHGQAGVGRFDDEG